MNVPPLSSFDDIHTHRRTGPAIICSIEPDEMPLSGVGGEAWYSVGIHPWSTVEPIKQQTLDLLDRLALDPRVVAIGETGLDALRGGEQAYQETIFLHHAALAERVHKPLIIHCVRRYGRLMQLHQAFKPQQLWVVHGFRGKTELARQLAAQGIGISQGIHRVAGIENAVPPHLLFNETDTAAPTAHDN